MTAIGATFGLSPFPEVGRRMFTWWLRALPRMAVAMMQNVALGKRQVPKISRQTAAGQKMSQAAYGIVGGIL